MAIKQVDISAKRLTRRKATASGSIILKPSTIELIRKGQLEKGDPLQLARIAATSAVKFTPQLMPLCHPIKIEGSDVGVKVDSSAVTVTVQVNATDKTGVEMEALTGVMAGLLNIWDVVKAYEKDEEGQYPSTKIVEIKVLEKVKEYVETP